MPLPARPSPGARSAPGRMALPFYRRPTPERRNIMGLSSWLRTWKRSEPGQRRRVRQRASFRPRLEALEGRDLPSFLAPASYPVGPGPQGVASADLNGDGKLDLITANYTSQTV